MGVNGRTLNYQNKEISFEVFCHEQKLTALSIVGVRPLTMKLGLSKGEQSRTVWHVSYLDTEQLDLHLPRINRKRQSVTFAPVVLAAMIATRNKGIDPLTVRGWSNYISGRGSQAVFEAYREWVENQQFEEVNNAS